MMALVRIALKRPYTFVVLALLILVAGTLSALRTPTDIFPNIPIPVISVVWQYTGLPADQMTGRIMTPFERALTPTVNNIEHIEHIEHIDDTVDDSRPMTPPPSSTAQSPQ
jgi:multidrug efflux pump subunit AcrB